MTFTRLSGPLFLAAAFAAISSTLDAATLPLIVTEQQRLSVSGLPAGTTADGFGRQLKVSGDTAVFLGSKGQGAMESLAIYIYIYQDGSWVFQHSIPYPDFSPTRPCFDLEGDTLAVGAPGFNEGPLSNVGRIHLFKRSNGVWAPAGFLRQQVARAGTFLGESFALQGNTVMALTRGDSGDAVDYRKKLHFFDLETQAEQVVLTDTVEPAFAPADAELPYRLALHGDYAVLGSPSQVGQGGRQGAGAVYTFKRRNGVWGESFPAAPAVPLIAHDYFGTSVAFDGETLVVGAVQGNILSGEGRAFVFSRSGDHWILQQVLTDDTPGTIDRPMRFGARLDIQGDTLLVGGPGASVNGRGSQAGAAFVFLRRDDHWYATRRLLPEGTDNENTAFGSALALHGEDSMLIASKEDDGSSTADPLEDNRGVILSLGLIRPQGMPLYLLDLADKDHDESLSGTEWNDFFPVTKKTAGIFAMLDVDASGSLDYLELDDALADPASPATYLRWMEYLQMAEDLQTDSIPSLDREEVRRMFPPGKAGMKRTDAFMNRAGSISSITVAEWIQSKGLPTPAQHAAAVAERARRASLAAELDVNDDNALSRLEFAALFPAGTASGKIDAAWHAATGTPKKLTPPDPITHADFIEAPVLPKVRVKK